MRVAVIGAGPAGMTAALRLAQRGARVEVFEADDRVGGLARTLDLWGQRVDVGPHRFFSTDVRVNRLWLDLVGRDYRMVNRLTRIYYQGQFFHYPLEPADIVAKLGSLEAARCLASYARRRWAASRDEPDTSFESWVIARFGRRLFEKFFKTYSEKLWGIPCSELDADFAAQRIKGFSLGEAVRSFLLPSARADHKTLVDRFAYPTGGTGMVYERMAQSVRDLGGQIHLRTPVRRVTCERDRVTGVELTDGRKEPFDHVISTMPLTLLVRGLGDPSRDVLAAVDALTFRNTVLVYLRVDSASLFPDQWIYVHSPDLGMGRITNFRNWTPDLYGSQQETILAVEYWCNHDDALWTEPQETSLARATRELRSTGLLGDAQVSAGHVVRIPRCYPVYRRGYRRHVARLAEHLRGFNGLTAIGRYGAFKYNNQDHSILLGLLAAGNLLDGEQHDLWAINTDYDDYQEESLIDETGLVEVAAHV